jgi:hypothetical protein
VQASHRILVGFAVLLLLAIPLHWLFERSAAFGYLFGVVITTAYFLYLLLLFNGSDNPPNERNTDQRIR